MSREAKDRRRWTDDQLIRAVQEVDSMSQLLRTLGLVPRGGNYITVKKYIQTLGLDTSHWLGQSWVGKRGTPPTLRSLQSILVQNSDYSTSRLRKRLIDSGLKEHRCEECHRTEWRGEPIPLEVDHANGVRDDHRIENLRLLCPNCHAQTPTWRGRNIRKNAAPPNTPGGTR